MHVDFNSETGFSGLPPEWDALLKSSDISKEDVINNSTAVISALEFYENGYKPAAEVPKKPTPVPAKEKPVDVKNEPAEKLEPAKEDPKLREDRREQLDIDALTESEWIDEGDPEEFYSEITKVGEGYIFILPSFLFFFCYFCLFVMNSNAVIFCLVALVAVASAGFLTSVFTSFTSFFTSFTSFTSFFTSFTSFTSFFTSFTSFTSFFTSFTSFTSLNFNTDIFFFLHPQHSKKNVFHGIRRGFFV